MQAEMNIGLVVLAIKLGLGSWNNCPTAYIAKH
jgi:hypothetical protein